jgi:hypothetical protein
VRASFKAQVQSNYTTVAASDPCATVYIEPGHAVCEMSNSQSAIDLEDVLDQINNNPAVNKTVNDNTTIWIESRGGNGGSAGSGGNTESGDDALAPLAGDGGGYSGSPPREWFNQAGVILDDMGYGGQGGAPGDGPSPGGGGALAAGGGGVQGKYDIGCTAGGGGSSYAQASTETCSLAPTSLPNNPNGWEGFVQIGVDLGACRT